MSLSNFVDLVMSLICLGTGIAYVYYEPSTPPYFTILLALSVLLSGRRS